MSTENKGWYCLRALHNATNEARQYSWLSVTKDVFFFYNTYITAYLRNIFYSLVETVHYSSHYMHIFTHF